MQERQGSVLKPQDGSLVESHAEFFGQTRSELYQGALDLLFAFFVLDHRFRHAHSSSFFFFSKCVNASPESRSNGATEQTPPRSSASFGIPNTTEVSSSWAMVNAPDLRISSIPSAPSQPMPVMITPTACFPATRATERNRTSALGR